MQTGSVPGLPDSNPARQSNMLKQHGELHSVQIQGGRMLAHSVLPGRTTAASSAAGPGSGTLGGGGGKPHTPSHSPHPASAGLGKERITYMMPQEPVPAACAANNATAIQITQQPTYLSSPLVVPNPAGKVISRYSNPALQIPPPNVPSTTSATGTALPVPPLTKNNALKTDNALDKTNVEKAKMAIGATACAVPPCTVSAPQKHFTNTDTQTADLPGDQWHRPAPFQRMGMPHKNIPVANVNPMVHSKSSSPALHPKKQILFQSRSSAASQGHTEVKPEGSASSSAESTQVTFIAFFFVPVFCFKLP